MKSHTSLKLKHLSGSDKLLRIVSKKSVTNVAGFLFTKDISFVILCTDCEEETFDA